jgi:hypothetical protein
LYTVADTKPLVETTFHTICSAIASELDASISSTIDRYLICISPDLSVITNCRLHGLRPSISIDKRTFRLGSFPINCRRMTTLCSNEIKLVQPGNTLTPNIRQDQS